MISGKKVLITGGAGFIGSNLCQKLLEMDNKVFCLDNLYTGRMENIASFLDNPNFAFIEHDVTEPYDIECDLIFNLACPASPIHYQADPIKTMLTNVLGAINALNNAKKYDAIILQASTSEVYGDPLIHPQVENYRGNVNPDGIRACYDEGKRSAETIFFDYNRKYGTKIKIARIFNTYGPKMRQDDGRVISNFIVQALKNEKLTVYGNGDQTRSFCYIDDLIDGFLKLISSEDSFTGPCNLGNPGEFTILELCDLICQKIKTNSKIVFCKLPSDDPTKRKPNIDLAINRLNWKPHTSLNDGLDKTIEYFRKDLKK